MILVTLGTQKEQFTRLLDYIENSNIDDEIIVQAGHTKYDSKKMKIFDFIPYEKMNEYIDKSDIIITHSGTGSVLMPLKKGKKVIICARLKKYGEHVDDHQQQLADIFKEEGYVLELNENNSLDDLMEKIKSFKPKKYESNTENFKKNLKKEIDITNSTNIKKKINNPIFINTLIIFFSFLLISFFVPLTGDDWTNANFHTNNILKIISIAYDKYFLYEGRFMSRIFVLFFTNTKYLWNIFNAIMVSVFYNFSMKIIKPKHLTFISLLYVFSMIMVENTVFTQSYLWVTGNMTYYLPMFLFLMYIYSIKKIFDNEFKFNKFVIIISIILNILIPTMVEHVSVALVCANILLLLYSSINEKKLNKLFFVNSIISIIGFLIIYLSPGAKIRTQTTLFYNYSLMHKIQENIPNFVNYTYVSNTVLLILLLMLIVLFINKHIKGIKKIVTIVVLSIVPVLTIIYRLLGLLSCYSNKINYILSKLSFLSNSNSIFIIVFWILISLLLIYINLIYIRDTKNYKAFFFFTIGMIANLSMLLSPIWGGRTSLFTIIMLSISLLILVDNYNFNIKKQLNIFLYIIFISHITILLVLYSSVYRQQNFREKSISKQVNSEINIITIERFPEDVLWNSNAWNKFHENSFKTYYGINSDAEINRTRVDYKYRLLYRR